MAASSEISTGDSFYVSAKLAWRDRASAPLYSPVEEAVCNAAARKSLPSGFVSALDSLMQKSPIGYCDFELHRSVSQQSWNLVIGALVKTTGSDITKCNVNPVAFVSVPILTAKIKQEVPVYLVDDSDNGFKGFTASFTIGPNGVIETESLFKAIRKTGNEDRLRSDWEIVRSNLDMGLYTNGMNLKRLKGSRDRWSVRLSLDARVGLINTEGDIFAVFAALKSKDFENAFLRKSFPPSSLSKGSPL